MIAPNGSTPTKVVGVQSNYGQIPFPAPTFPPASGMTVVTFNPNAAAQPYTAPANCAGIIALLIGGGGGGIGNDNGVATGGGASGATVMAFISMATVRLNPTFSIHCGENGQGSTESGSDASNGSPSILTNGTALLTAGGGEGIHYDGTNTSGGVASASGAGVIATLLNGNDSTGYDPTGNTNYFGAAPTGIPYGSAGAGGGEGMDPTGNNDTSSQCGAPGSGGCGQSNNVLGTNVGYDGIKGQAILFVLTYG